MEKQWDSSGNFLSFTWVSNIINVGVTVLLIDYVKLKSPLKQMEVGDSPITLDDITVKDHFFRDVFAVESYWHQWRCLHYMVALTGCSCSET